MLHELFITHCTKSTSIMNSFTVWMLYRWTCGCTQMLLLFTMDAQQMDMLMHSDFVNYCYCLLWMPQQMDLLLQWTLLITVKCYFYNYCYLLLGIAPSAIVCKYEFIVHEW